MRVDNAVQQSSGQSGSKTQERGALGKDDFLKLLVTQLQYQDPLNPTDNTQFVAQLAQFSSLEGITNLQQTAEGMKGSIDSMQNYSSASLIGRSIRADGNSFEYSGAPVALGYALSDNAREAVLTVRNPSGGLVRSVDLGAVPAGDHAVAWDGRDNNGTPAAPGTYSFMVSAKGVDGSTVGSSTFVTGQVSGISLDESGASLMVGPSKVSRDRIKAVY